MVGETQPAKAPSARQAASSKGKVASNKGKGKAVERSNKQPMVTIKEGSVGDGETVELGDEIEVFFSLRLRDGTMIENQHSEPVRHFVRTAALFRLIFCHQYTIHIGSHNIIRGHSAPIYLVFFLIRIQVGTITLLA